MSYEYKCIAAPERAKRKRGAKTRTERVASAMQEVIATEAVDGWEYMRTDLVPTEEKAGLFSRTQEVHRAVLVFRRARMIQAPVYAPQQPQPMPQPVMAPQPQPQVQPQPQMPQVEEPVLQPAEESIKLAAERPAAPAPQPAGNGRPPTGLG